MFRLTVLPGDRLIRKLNKHLLKVNTEPVSYITLIRDYDPKYQNKFYYQPGMVFLVYENNSCYHYGCYRLYSDVPGVRVTVIEEPK